MTRYTVGCVSYVNAIPLVEMFEEMGAASPVRVLYDVPSRLPALLESGEADAILVSSVDALRVADRRMAEGVCIGSRGAVKSVRLFSKVPPAEIQKLALDQSSMTSNRLAQIILGERYGVRPETVELAPNLETMLEQADACVLIGDIGMMTDGSGLTVLDLGAEWVALTGKPFVWAAWIGNEKVTPELAWWLNRAAACVGSSDGAEPEYIWRNRKTMVARAMSQANWPEETARDYFESVMAYKMDDSMLEGLREYQRRLLANGFEDATHFPELIGAAEGAVA
ncbi:MAG: menaquinone biosynthesis protein [Armatimonadetes bacterium]|nr:menaquinone biosynthesis protein [Armatimonadota bacterium]